MAGGAEESGDDMVVGRTNVSEERTLLLASNGDNAPNGYEADFVLNVSTQGDKVLVSSPHGVDGIHAKGTVAFPTGGAIGTIPAGNGVIARGINGAVGYVHAAARNKPLEHSVGAGVLGVGGIGAAGVFGSGRNGVVGYEQATPRDTAFETAQRAGVLGRGDTGVSGDGANGPGVFGRGLPGVHGLSDGGPGLLGDGQTGVVATGRDGPGVIAASPTEQGAVLESRRMAQLLMVPLRIENPLSLAHSTAGELLTTVWPDREQRGAEITSLWFCKVGGSPAQASWVKLAQAPAADSVIRRLRPRGRAPPRRRQRPVRRAQAEFRPGQSRRRPDPGRKSVLQVPCRMARRWWSQTGPGPPPGRNRRRGRKAAPVGSAADGAAVSAAGGSAAGAGRAGRNTSPTTPMMNLSPGLNVVTTRVAMSRLVDTQPAEGLFPAPKKMA